MDENILKLFMMVAICWAVTFSIRLFPFLLPHSKKGGTSHFTSLYNDIAAPLIIASLIIYSYSDLEWKSVYPYLAGVITVFIHALKRRPLFSILAGTVFYMCALSCGCATQNVDVSNSSTELHLYNDCVRFKNKSVTPADVVDILRGENIPRTRTIHILVDSSVRDLSYGKKLLSCLTKAGYTRAILVTQKHSSSAAVGRPKPVMKWSRDETPEPRQRRVRGS